MVDGHHPARAAGSSSGSRVAGRLGRQRQRCSIDGHGASSLSAHRSVTRYATSSSSSRVVELHRRHQRARLERVGVVDPGAQVLGRVRRGARAERLAAHQMGEVGAEAPVGDACRRTVWQLMQAVVSKSCAARLRPRRRRAAGACCAATQRSNSAARVHDRRAAASARAGCRSTRRTGRGRCPGSRGSIHMRLRRFGMTSVLPASRGTQKLWTTSADSSVEEGRRRAAPGRSPARAARWR